MVGVALNDTELPAQLGFVPEDCTIDTDGVRIGLTVIVIAFDVAGLPVTPAKFDVITQVTI